MPNEPMLSTQQSVMAAMRAVAMTTTIEAVWGSRVMSDGGTGLPGGFLLNNQLTDFSLAPADARVGRSPTGCSPASARAAAWCPR